MAVATADNVEEMESIAEEEQPTVPLKLKIIHSALHWMDYFIFRKDYTVNRTLQHYVEPKAAANSTPVNGVSTTDAVIDDANKVWLRVFLPTQEKDEEKKLPIIFFYHGGGFVTAHAHMSAFDQFCRLVAKSCNAVVLSVEYRRAPEFPFPTAYDDCWKAFDWLLSPESRSVLPATADLGQCFLMGDSAGANIVHFMGCRAAERDISPIQIRGMVEIQPFFGGEELTKSETNMKGTILRLDGCLWAWKAFLPAGSNRDHFACNVVGPNALDISKLSLPPILVVIGSLDILKDRQTQFVQYLKEQGKHVTERYYVGGFHGFYIIDVNHLTKKVQADIFDFVRSHTQ